ncbi:MAG: FG-GAP-like repeat-containing protein [Bryobacteraceae bacterium]
MASQQPIGFTERTIATGLKGGYQVLAVDLNGDGRKDILALASDLDELVWYENPSWTRHVIASGRRRMINVAVWDWDGDGIPEIVLAEEFSPNPAKSAGVVSVLTRHGDPRQPWSVHEIDRLPTSHRLRLARIDASGKPVVVNAPLAGATAEPPEYRARTPLVFYRPGEWKRELITDATEGVMHGIFVLDWDGDGRDEILTASMSGIHLLKLGKDGRWSRRELTKGDPAPWPKSGASDIAVGHLGKKRFLAAIEPWHGHQLAVYFEQKGAWHRQVIESGMVDGHALLVVDLDGDGRDEIVAGYRGGDHSVHLYRAADAAGRNWMRAPVDEGGMAAASCDVADFGAGRPEIVCIGTATANVKCYLPRTKSR